jgi:hypothetical protein
MMKISARSRFRRDHRWTPSHLSDFVDGDLPPRSRTRLTGSVHVRWSARTIDQIHGDRVDPAVLSAIDTLNRRSCARILVASRWRRILLARQARLDCAARSAGAKLGR